MHVAIGILSLALGALGVLKIRRERMSMEGAFDTTVLVRSVGVSS